MKKILSLVLSLTICVSLAAPAMAAEEITPEPPLDEEQISGEADPGLAPDAPGSVGDLVTDSGPEGEGAESDTKSEPGEGATETPPEPPIEEEIPDIVFSDVPEDHTFYKGIIYCAGKGIVNGYADGTFRPANTVTKNHFCAMLARAFYADQIAKYDTDYVKKECGTFGPTTQTLLSNRILRGTSFQYSSNNASTMNTGINRYDMAQMMTNIMQAKGFAASTSQKNAIQAKITDYKNIPSQYQDAVKNVYALGIITGYGDGSFVGTNIMNRGQAAIVIQRMAQYAPVTGDKDNDQFDDGTSQKPEPKPEPTPDPKPVEPTPDPKPEIPETPTGNTLTNGKPITEANVLAILNDLKAQWNKKDMGPYSQGGKSAIRSVTNRYRISGSNLAISTTYDCGGGAARVFDAVFGQNVTLRPVSGGYDAARPGDLLIQVDPNGKAMHVAIVYDRGNINGIANMLTTIDANMNGGGNKLIFGLANYNPIKYELGYTYEFYTAYPD